MNTLTGGIKIALVAILATLVDWLMGCPFIFIALFLAQALDVVSALIAAGAKQEVNSDAFGKGWRKKAAAWVVVLLVLLLEASYPNSEFPVVVAGLKPSGMAAAGFVAMESISILENTVRAGITLPPFVVKTLAVAKRDYLGTDD